MRKRAALAFLVLICAALLGGCWNYRGLDEMTIATGIGIDRDPATGLYHMSFEYVDLSGPVKEQGIAAGLLESYGVTLFDAFQNSKKRVTNKVYLGQVEVVVLDESVARDTDISSILDIFLRDAECRETMCVVISQTETAKELLSLEGVGQPMVAYEVYQIIEQDRKVTASTVHQPVYKMYDILHTEGVELTLPVIRSVPNDQTLTCEINGIAVFKGERLVGYLTPDEAGYFLLATDHVQGGVITVPASGEGPDDTSLEVYETRSHISFARRDGQLVMKVNVDIKVFLNETGAEVDLLDLDAIGRVEAVAEQKVVRGIADVIQRVRTEYGSDIFGFGRTVYRKDYKLWQQLKDRWDEVFVTMPVEISCNVDVANTAYLKKT